MRTLAFFGRLPAIDRNAWSSLLGQSANLFARVLGFCQRAAHDWPRNLPCSTIEQANTGIAEKGGDRPLPARAARVRAPRYALVAVGASRTV
jgi:hypothetical protein